MLGNDRLSLPVTPCQSKPKPKKLSLLNKYFPLRDSATSRKSGRFARLRFCQAFRSVLISDQCVDPFTADRSQDSLKFSFAAADGDRSLDSAQAIKGHSDHPLIKSPSHRSTLGVIKTQANVSHRPLLLNAFELFFGEYVAAAGYQVRWFQCTNTHKRQCDLFK
jgi:hypothetical protein